MGHERKDAHEVLPVVMLAIGVDDMFVICNALDQSSLKKSAKERFIECVRNAGPSITINSLTNCIAFLAGMTSGIPVINYICIYAAVAIAMFYISVMTLFLSTLYCDTLRVSRKYKECFGLFQCDKNSIFFCKGACLSSE